MAGVWLHGNPTTDKYTTATAIGLRGVCIPRLSPAWSISAILPHRLIVATAARLLE